MDDDGGGGGVTPGPKNICESIFGVKPNRGCILLIQSEKKKPKKGKSLKYI